MLRLDALAISGATLELPTSTEPFEFPRWPDSLPQIAPPLALQADAIRIDDLQVTRDGVPLVAIRRHAAGSTRPPADCMSSGWPSTAIAADSPRMATTCPATTTGPISR